MQKHLSVLAVIVIAMSLHSISYAQIEKGTKLIGGSVNFYNDNASNKPDTSQSRQNSDSFNFSTRIDAGYFIKDNVALGLRGGYLYGNSKSESHFNESQSTNNSKSRGGNLGVFIKYYIPIVSKLYVVLVGDGSFHFSKINNSSKNIETDYSYNNDITAINKTISLSINPGVAYFVTKKFALEATISGLSASHNFGEETRKREGVNYNSIKRSTTAFNLNPLDFKLGDLYIGGKFYF